jgi:hypothetical protein
MSFDDTLFASMSTPAASSMAIACSRQKVFKPARQLSREGMIEVCLREELSAALVNLAPQGWIVASRRLAFRPFSRGKNLVTTTAVNELARANARRVTIHIGFGSGMLVCSIEDGGSGFDVPSSHRNKCFDLIGMRERLHAGQGRLSIDRSPHRGTKLLIRVPSNKESHSHVNSRRTC